MIIRDKQELRRCVKQAVRRADVVETRLDFDMRGGEMGVARLMDTWAPAADSPGEAVSRACAQGTPLMRDAACAFAALGALDLPAHDADKAQAIQAGYDREAYLSRVLRAMRARRVLVPVRMRDAEPAAFFDERFAPLLTVDREAFAPGRYGVDYQDAARRIAQAARACGARDVTPEAWDAQALAYCFAPLCEDERLVLHVRPETKEQIAELAAIMDEHPRLRAVAAAPGEIERGLIEAAAPRQNLLVRLDDPSRMGEAVGALGTRVLAYAARASLPEQMLGRWIRAKEVIWQSLYEAYLPLARAGYALTDEAIERDAARILGGAYLELLTENDD